MSVPAKWVTHKFLGYSAPQWILIVGLLPFGAAALEGNWDVYVRVGIAVLIVDRMFS